MQEKHLFEYAVIRVVPHVEREEFLNAGIVLYCPAQKFLKAIVDLDAEGTARRLQALDDGLDMQELREHLASFKRICNGGSDSGPIGKLSLAERFRWLTATRSTVVQTSKVHPGLCADAGEMLRSLYNQLVL